MQQVKQVTESIKLSIKKLEFNEMELIDKVVVFCDGDLKKIKKKK